MGEHVFAWLTTMRLLLGAALPTAEACPTKPIADLSKARKPERVVAQLLSGRDPEIPLGPFDPRRFA